MKAYVKPCVKYNHANNWMASSGAMDKYAGCVISITKNEFDEFYKYKDLHGHWYWPANALIIITEQNKHKFQNKKEFLS